MRARHFLFFLTLAGLCATQLGCGSGGDGDAKPVVAGGKQPDASAAKVKIEDIKVGTGEPAKPGEYVVVDYTGGLTDGTKFDSSIDRREPFKFRLGAGNVIKGWDQGVEGMRVGGKRKLTIPSELGYGKRGSPPKIPPDATLIFDIELLKVE